MFFSKPHPPGEYRYAVAVEEDGVLRFALVVSRRFKKTRGVWECFILMQRDSEWDPHASYHADGTYHQVSYYQKWIVIQRQPLDQFKGTEHLGSFQGLSWAVCNPTNFTDVIKVPKGILTCMRGSVLIDLVEPGVSPETSDRQNIGQTITDGKTYTECSPWVVIAIAKQEMP